MFLLTKLHLHKTSNNLPATTNTRTKFSHLQKVAFEALYKESRYPSQGVIEEFLEFAKLSNHDGATIKVWFNNKQRDTPVGLLRLNFHVL